MSVNKVILVGNVGQDPEIRHLDNGKKVAKFSLATSEKYNNETHTTWHNIVIWDKLAEIVEKYVKKGQLLYLDGKIQVRKYEEKFYTDIVCYGMQMLGKKSDNQQSTATSTNKSLEQASSNVQPEGPTDLPF